MIHPLINSQSKHYDNNSTNAITELEKELNIDEMIGFCKGNIFKYKFRLEYKGQKDSDIVKIDSYTRYLKLLIYVKTYTCNTINISTTKCIENAGISFE